MGSNKTRKEAIREYRERKTPRGAFAVRCAVTGNVWVGSSPNLEAARNGLWFTLGIGSHREPSLQAEWNAHGENAFRFEILEQLPDDILPMAVNDQLKDLKQRWTAELGARPLLP